MSGRAYQPRLVTLVEAFDALQNSSDAGDVLIAKTSYAYDNYAAMGGMENNGGGANPLGHFVGWFWAGYATRPFSSVASDRLYADEGTNDPTNRDVALGLAAINLGASFQGDARRLAQDIWKGVCGQSSELTLP